MKQRNIVVLGRIGAGKSTVVNQIVDKNVFKVRTPLESVTSEADSSEEETVDVTRKVQYKIKKINTVGLYNVNVRGADIMKDIKTYSRSKVPEGINLVLFIFRRGVFTVEDQKAFDFIIRNFKNEIKDISALVITGCEGLDSDGREKLKQELKTDQHTQFIARSMGKGIYPVGFPSTDKMILALKDVYEEGMKADAEELRSVVMSAEEKRLPAGEIIQVLALRESSEFRAGHECVRHATGQQTTNWGNFFKSCNIL